MSLFEELSRDETRAGTVTLWRRRDPQLRIDVFEVKLGDEYLMSSLFTAGEVELARLGLDAHGGEDLDVVVGGLGLGSTTRAALDHPRAASVRTIEAVPAVVDWHRRGLLPDTAGLADDARSTLQEGDFFALALDGGLPGQDGDGIDVLLLDIDHAPDRLLHPSHAAFYTPDGLHRLRSQLRPGGVFALWSTDAPDDGFLDALDGAFTDVESHVVDVPNPYTGEAATNTVYTALSGPRPTTPGPGSPTA